MMFWRKIKKLESENKELRQDASTLKLLIRSYMRSDKKLRDEIEVLNASIKALEADRDKWKGIAHKADERRVAYVRRMVR